jgi:hypothetical protein
MEVESMKEDFQAVFTDLKRIYQSLQVPVTVTADEAGNYSLNAPYSSKHKKELFFGAVQIKKNYVSYYLMPVYMFPDLLEGISPGLKKHMQGKSCFNFKSVDSELFAELEALTVKSTQRMQSEGLL